MKKPFERRYTKHYLNVTPEGERLIIKRLRDQWEESERALKKHELIGQARRAGLEVGKWILGLGLAAGTLMIAAAAPNAVGAIIKIGGGAKRHYASVSQSDFKRQLARGSSKKYWHYRINKIGTCTIELTKKGRQVALRNELRNFKLKPRPAWKGDWRLVMFDIPKKYSAGRDLLRRKFIEIGLYPVQESVFVYPSPCEEEVQMWTELFGLGDYVEIATAHFGPVLTGELKQVFKLK